MKPNRQYFEVKEVKSNYELDLLGTSLAKFKSYLTRPFSFIQFKPGYVGNLDKLSYEIYEVEELWWVIAIANDIIDPFTNELVGTLLKLPDLLDINDFYTDNYENYRPYTTS